MKLLCSQRRPATDGHIRRPRLRDRHRQDGARGTGLAGRNSTWPATAKAILKNHGGQYQAVYCYPHEHYAYWSERLGRDDFAFGQFGENFTTLGLLENEVCVGDTLRIAGALIQVTQPRVPCYKLANKLGIPGFDKTFLRANRSGFYAQVLEEGEVAAGDPITRVSRDPVGMTIAEVNAALLLDKARPP